MTDKLCHPTPTEQAAIDARPEPDASGDPRQTWPTQRWRDEVLGPPEGGGTHAPDTADKQQAAQRQDNTRKIRSWEEIANEWRARSEVSQERWQRLVNAVSDAFNQGTVPGSNTESVEWAIQTIHAQAAEIVGLSRRADNQDRWARKYRAEAALAKQQNAALREVLTSLMTIIDGDYDSRQWLDAKAKARAALGASDE